MMHSLRAGCVTATANVGDLMSCLSGMAAEDQRQQWMDMLRTWLKASGGVQTAGPVSALCFLSNSCVHPMLHQCAVMWVGGICWRQQERDNKHFFNLNIIK